MVRKGNLKTKTAPNADLRTYLVNVSIAPELAASNPQTAPSNASPKAAAVRTSKPNATAKAAAKSKRKATPKATPVLL